MLDKRRELPPSSSPPNPHPPPPTPPPWNPQVEDKVKYLKGDNLSAVVRKIVSQTKDRTRDPAAAGERMDEGDEEEGDEGDEEEEEEEEEEDEEEDEEEGEELGHFTCAM